MVIFSNSYTGVVHYEMNLLWIIHFLIRLQRSLLLQSLDSLWYISTKCKQFYCQGNECRQCLNLLQIILKGTIYYNHPLLLQKRHSCSYRNQCHGLVSCMSFHCKNLPNHQLKIVSLINLSLGRKGFMKDPHDIPGKMQ